MKREEVINQLKDLIEDRKSFMVGDYDKDVQALEYAIKELTAPEVPVQEQLIKFDIEGNLKIDSKEIAKVVINELRKQQKQSNITITPV
ncbi:MULTISPECIES: hypothetical protein [unclassified Clostridium]|uniref:hypothetical protein n=1 Tax=unclassified Clostridium TaxID=2614128 RepID=UPI00290B99C8|nr:hypothetical protein [Clostridium sp.]MDU5107160.1 hypothetical protein [Clostridium sp.]